MTEGRFLRNVLVKALLLFLAFNLLLQVWQPGVTLSRLSLYNSLFPGRERFPFGENPQAAYNLSLYDLDAMFTSHTVTAAPAEDIYRVFIIGDSSVWGTLLRPEETLAGQLNQMALTTCEGRPVEFFNLGYPTISLFKDVMVLDQAMQSQPDLILWLTTLEAFPPQRQFDSAIVANNASRVMDLIQRFDLPFDPADPALQTNTSMTDRSLFGQRRPLADLIRLQLYGILWAATGIDQTYPTDYTPAARDLEADGTWQGLNGPELPGSALSLDLIQVGSEIAGEVPLWLVNEPILISQGANSNLRYNFFYPRWAYDAYRSQLASFASDHALPWLDYWNAVPQEEFTNSAIHLTPDGEALFARTLAVDLQAQFCP